MTIKKGGKIVIYQDKTGEKTVNAGLEEKTVRLSQKQMADLFGKDVRTVN